jgi:hypothetical protein
MSLFNHRLPALSAAFISSAAVLTAAFAGASCNFVIREDDDNSSFGVLCEHHIYPRDGDDMWELSRIFLIIGLSLGSLTSALSWAVASYLTPTSFNWNGISVLAAITAVIQIPIFVLFEAEPCSGNDFDSNIDNDNDNAGGGGGGISGFFSKTITTSCKLGSGSYLLIASDLLYIAVTLITQCLDKPRWGLELDLWRVPKQGESSSSLSRGRRVPTNASSPRNDEYYYDDNENYNDHLRLRGAMASNGDDDDDNDEEGAIYHVSRILPAAKQSKNRNNNNDNRSMKKNRGGFFSRLFSNNNNNDHMEVPAVETESMNEEDNDNDEYDYENQQDLHVLDNSRLLLRVIPPTDDNNVGKKKKIKIPIPALFEAEEEEDDDEDDDNDANQGHEVSIGSFGKIVGDAAEDNDDNKNVMKEEEQQRPPPKFNNNNNKNINETMMTMMTMMPVASDNSTVMLSDDVDVVERHQFLLRHQLIDSPPQMSFNDSASIGINKSSSFVSTRSANDILEDLHSEELVGAAPPPSSSLSPTQPPTVIATINNSSTTNSSTMTSDTIILGVRKLTKKLKLADSKRRSKKGSGVLDRYRSKGGGYSQMMNDDDDEYNDDDGDGDEQQYDRDGADETEDENNNNDIMSPPSEVKWFSNENEFCTQDRNVSGNNDDAANNMHVLDVSLDDEDLFKDDSFIVGINNWDDVVAAGVELEDTSKSPFDYVSMGPSQMNSDPGLIVIADSSDADDDSLPINISRGEHSTTITDIFAESAFMLESKNDDDSNLFATEDFHEIEPEFDYQERGRSSERSSFDRRSRRRAISPVGSIKSNCSLLQLTINEETEEDIKNELNMPYSMKRTVSARKDELVTPYSMKRTLSAPEHRSSGSVVSTRGKSTEELLQKLEKLKSTRNSIEDFGREGNDNESPANEELNEEDGIISTNQFSINSQNSIVDDSAKTSSDEEICGPIESNEEPKDLQENDDSSSRKEILNMANEQIEDIPKLHLDDTDKNVPVGEHAYGYHYDSQNNVHPTPTPTPTPTPSPSHPPLHSPVKHAWKEPELPTKKVWNDESEQYNQFEKVPAIPSKEPWIEPIIPTKKTTMNESSMDTPFDITDETSDSDGTRSTISDSDGSSANGSETGPRHIRSKSMGARNNRKNRRHKAATSLSPTRPGHCVLDGNLLSSRALRIRRMQRLNGYVPLDERLVEDLELTPKRKTAGISMDEKQDDDDTNESNLPECLFQPSLNDSSQICPEFDTMLESLDLQLIDLRRPLGAEYGDDEGSM